MLRPRPLHINWFAFDEVQFTIWQGRTNFTSDSRQHFSNVSENLCFGHLTDGNPSYDFRSPAIGAANRCILKPDLVLRVWPRTIKEKALMSDGIRRIVALS